MSSYWQPCAIDITSANQNPCPPTPPNAKTANQPLRINERFINESSSISILSFFPPGPLPQRPVLPRYSTCCSLATLRISISGSCLSLVAAGAARLRLLGDRGRRDPSSLGLTTGLIGLVLAGLPLGARGRAERGLRCLGWCCNRNAHHLAGMRRRYAGDLARN